VAADSAAVGVVVFIVTSPTGVVAKCCGKYVCLCVFVCPTGYLRDHMRDLYQFFVHVAYVRASVLLRHVYDRPHHLSPGRGFLPIESALSTRKGEMGVHSAGEVCCLRLPCFPV